MNRRNAVKNVLGVSASLITLPFWMEACRQFGDSNTFVSFFSPDEQEMLAKITDTIIPVGNSVGALSMGVDKFLQKMIIDCYEKPAQDNVRKQLQLLDASAKSANGKSFIDCTQAQREGLLLKLQGSSQKEQKDFFELVKTETIRGFNTSQTVMEKYLGYKVAPGHYYGCINIKT
jgi:hypothetical protein